MFLKNFFGVHNKEREKIFEVLPYIPKNLPEITKPKKDTKFLGPKDLGTKREETLPKERIPQNNQSQTPAIALKPMEKIQEHQTQIKDREKIPQPISIPEKRYDDTFKVPITDSKENIVKEDKKTYDKTEAEKQHMPEINKLIPRSQDILAKLPKEESINLDRGSVKSGKELIVNTKEFKYWAYLQKMKQKIETVWEYPEYARQRGIGGQLKINFSIGKDGKIEKVMLIDSSGLKVLDDAALKALRDASPFPPFPETWDISRLNIEGTFIYHITVIR
jgi:protein TonB